jgi:hemin uptake protein HemP
LFFLGQDSVCRSVRIVCDKNMMPLKVKELNSQYVKKGDNKWIDKHEGKSYMIELQEGNWSCIISIESEK